MLEEELKLNEAISAFIAAPEISEFHLAQFLTNWAAHPDDYTDFTGRVINNLAALNLALLNALDGKKRFHLMKALCLTVNLAFSMKQWEDMLGRKDGAWYWDNHGLFFSSLHDFIPTLNALQKHISEIEQGFTGRIICLEGDSERVFLEVLHLGSRLLQFNNQYFVYGGKGAHQNLVYYIRDKNDKGVRIDLAYDGDSNFTDQLSKLRQQVVIRNVFRFERDFEAAFPAQMLADAVTEYLQVYKDKSIVCSVEEVTQLLADRKPFVKALEEKHEISVSKPILGEFLAEELLKLAEHEDRVLQGAGTLTGTELSKFLRFVMDWPEKVSAEENEPVGEPLFDHDDEEAQSE